MAVYWGDNDGPEIGGSMGTILESSISATRVSQRPYIMGIKSPRDCPRDHLMCLEGYLEGITDTKTQESVPETVMSVPKCLQSASKTP